MDLRLKILNLTKKRIRVNHQLQRTSKMQYIIQAPKTEKGVRYVPMTDEVEQCFHKIIDNRITPVKEPVVDGHT